MRRNGNINVLIITEKPTTQFDSISAILINGVDDKLNTTVPNNIYLYESENNPFNLDTR